MFKPCVESVEARDGKLDGWNRQQDGDEPMLEPERSSDEALRQTTFVRLYRGALRIYNPRDSNSFKRMLEACFIILLAGRLGLRTGEIQHVREAWIDWRRGEIVIPRHDPCGCKNCWIAAVRKATDDEDTLRQEIRNVFEDSIPDATPEEIDEFVEQAIVDEPDLVPETLVEMGLLETRQTKIADHAKDEDLTPHDVLYQERWQPKYPRSARRVPFGHSRRLTAVLFEFFNEFDCLGMTQVTMRNRVKEAAELADGVDPENITIRGLRATAATHYATVIRNPGRLQDLMGWERIETASSYLRNAGAYTTDIVYHAFGKGDLAPAMYPEEPEQQFPIIMNPIPYQNEEWDPMLYDYDARMERARDLAGSPTRLIHPRTDASPIKNHPYDPTNHTIRTHEDYESEFIERADGHLAFERPTLAEIFDDHPRYRPEDIQSDKEIRRFESTEEWEQVNLFDHSDERAMGKPIRFGLIDRLTTEHRAAIESGKLDGYPPTKKQAVTIGVGLVAWSVLIGIIWGSMGVFYIDPMNFQMTVSPVLLVGLFIGTLSVLLDLPDLPVPSS